MATKEIKKGIWAVLSVVGLRNNDNHAYISLYFIPYNLAYFRGKIHFEKEVWVICI